MPHPLTLARLEDAVARPGCPVCWEMERTSHNYLARLLREHKGSEEVWKRLRRSWGLCLPHTRRMLAAEARTIAGFSTATLYRWLAEALLREAGRVGPGRHRGNRRGLRALLKLRADCLACEHLGDYEQAVVGGLVRTLASGEPATVREAYLHGDGLCLPHFRLALDLADRRDAVELLSERFLAGLEVLATELEAFLDAHTPGGADRAKADSDIWLRAAERFAGKLGPGD
jgi:hypothetical protein